MRIVIPIGVVPFLDEIYIPHTYIYIGNTDASHFPRIIIARFPMALSAPFFFSRLSGAAYII